MKLTVMDFELYNTYHYWSICWAGLISASDTFDIEWSLDQMLYPGVKQKHVGDEIEFPFTIEDLEQKPRFPEFAETLFSHFTPDTVVVGHAVQNDIRMVLAACRKYKLHCPSFRFFDTNLLLSEIKKNYREFSLASVAEEFGIEYEQHDPLEDARTTLAVLKRLCEEQDCTLGQLLDRCGVRLGRVQDGFVCRCYSESQPEKMRFRTDKLNRFYGYAMEHAGEKRGGRFAGKTFAFDNELIYHNNLEEVLALLLSEGGTVVTDPARASYRVVFQLSDKPKKTDMKFSILLFTLDKSKRPGQFYDARSAILDHFRKKKASGGEPVQNEK